MTTLMRIIFAISAHPLHFFKREWTRIELAVHNIKGCSWSEFTRFVPVNLGDPLRCGVQPWWAEKSKIVFVIFANFTKSTLMTRCCGLWSSTLNPGKGKIVNVIFAKLQPCLSCAISQITCQYGLLMCKNCHWSTCHYLNYSEYPGTLVSTKARTI